MIYELKATIENDKGIQIEKKVCYGDLAVSNERNHIRTCARRGSTITFEVKPLRG